MGPILVTGATGTLGSAVCRRVLSAGYEVRGLSRKRVAQDDGVDWVTGDLLVPASLGEVLSGVGTVIHCATSPMSRHGDQRGTRNLIEAARQAGIRHLVYISIVGIEAVPMRYYRTKLAVERMIEVSGLPYTIQRTTQFHDLVYGIIRQAARLPVVPVLAGVSLQPVDVREVADRLAHLAEGQPQGRVQDMGGPEVRTLTDLSRAYLKQVGRRRALLPVWLPGRAFRSCRQGALLATDHPDGHTSFENFLTEAPLP